MDIDPRGPRFGAAITTIVLAVVLITGSAWLLGAQLLVFAVGALFGLRYAPYGIVYRRLVRPRLGPPARTEAEAGPGGGTRCRTARTAARTGRRRRTRPAARRAARRSR